MIVTKCKPVRNGLSDNEAQLLTRDTVSDHFKNCQTVFQRQINRYTIADFQLQLSYRAWDTVFEGHDVNQIFNSFLKTYLRIFYSSSPPPN